MPDLVLEPRGPFSLPAAGRFLKDFPPADNQGPDERGTVRLAFVLDDYSGAAAVALRQADDDAPVEVAVAGTDRLDVVRGQLERILGLEHDAAPFLGVLDGDPVLRERWERTGHLRAVSFPSPYEAACWSVIALRLRQAQAVRVRQRIEERLGERIDVAGLPLTTFPVPDRLRELPGLGPFYATLVLVRATGATDAFFPIERLRRAAARAYEMADTPTEEAFTELAERWRPFRAWAGVLLRAGDR